MSHIFYDHSHVLDMFYGKSTSRLMTFGMLTHTIPHQIYGMITVLYRKHHNFLKVQNFLEFQAKYI